VCCLPRIIAHAVYVLAEFYNDAAGIVAERFMRSADDGESWRNAATGIPFSNFNIAYGEYPAALYAAGYRASGREIWRSGATRRWGSLALAASPTLGIPQSPEGVIHDDGTSQLWLWDWQADAKWWADFAAPLPKRKACESYSRCHFALSGDSSGALWGGDTPQSHTIYRMIVPEGIPVSAR
jgi:hypothetical protein